MPLVLVALLASGTPIAAQGFAADLAIVKIDSPDPAFLGDLITYNITVTNLGPDSATGASVVDSLPAGLSFVSASTGCSHAAGTVTCSLGNVAAGATRNLTITVRADTPGIKVNTANASSSRADPVSANNQAIATTLVLARADLAIDKEDAPDPVVAGDLFAYYVNVTNLGPHAATNVTVNDTFSPGLGVVAVSSTPTASCALEAGSFSCTLASLAANATWRIVATMEALTPGTKLNVAEVTSQAIDASPANNVANETTTVVTRPDLALTKEDSQDPVAVDGTFVYYLNVTNLGPLRAAGIEVVDQLPSEVTFVGATTGCAHDAGVVSCDLGDLDPNATATAAITVRAVAAGLATNRANVTSAQQDPEPSNNFANETTTILADVAPADLRLVKTDSDDPVQVGGTLSYVLNVTNLGPGQATGVVIVDELPPGMTFVSAPPGCAHDAGVVTCAVALLTSGGSAAFSIAVRADAPGHKLNRANATADEPDPVPANNVDTETTTVTAGVPGGLSCTFTGGAVVLEWSAASNATAYNVYRRVAGGGFTLLATTTNTTFTDATVEAGQSYGYRVTSLSAGGESPPSDECSVTAIPLFPSLVVGALALAGGVGSYLWMRRRR